MIDSCYQACENSILRTFLVIVYKNKFSQAELDNWDVQDAGIKYFIKYTNNRDRSVKFGIEVNISM